MFDPPFPFPSCCTPLCIRAAEDSSVPPQHGLVLTCLFSCLQNYNSQFKLAGFPQGPGGVCVCVGGGGCIVITSREWCLFFNNTKSMWGAGTPGCTTMLEMWRWKHVALHAHDTNMGWVHAMKCGVKHCEDNWGAVQVAGPHCSCCNTPPPPSSQHTPLYFSVFVQPANISSDLSWG